MKSTTMLKDARIDEITVEGEYNGQKEGYVYLRYGFRFGDHGTENDRQHGFGYLGQKEIKDSMKRVVKCACDSCKCGSAS